MKKNVMMKSLLTLSCACVAIGGIATLSTSEIQKVEAATATESRFYMTDGAQVKTTKDYNGIRFVSNVTDSYYESLQTTYGADADIEFHTLLWYGVDVEDLDVSDVTEDGLGAADIVNSQAVTFDATGKFTYKAAMYDIPEEAYSLEITARAYVKVTPKDGEPQIIYAETGDTVRSIRRVANAAMLHGDSDADGVLSQYLTVGQRNAAKNNFVKENATTLTVSMAGLEDTTITKAYLDAKEVPATFDGTTLSVTVDNATLNALGLGEHFVSVWDNSNKVYSVPFKYVTEVLTKDNFSTLKTATDGYYVLSEDIDLHGSEWTSDTDFTGVLDGNEYTVSGLQTAASKGLFLRLAGTIKDISFTDVKILHQGGVFAYTMANNTSAYLENVYVEVAQRFEDQWTIGKTQYTGLIGRSGQTSSKLYMTNCVVTMPKDSGTEYGYAFGYNGSTIMDNCYFAGGNGRVYGARSGYNGVAQGTLNEDYFLFDTVDAMLQAGAQNSGLPTFLVDSITANNTWIEVTQNNIKTTLMTATTGKYKLVEDIDMSKVSNWKPTATFSGIFDGNGKTISNLQTKSNANSLFYLVAGTIKNLAMVDVTVHSESGILGKNIAGNGATVENVFVEVVGYTSDSWNTNGPKILGLFGTKNGTARVYIKDVAMVMATPETTETSYGYILGRSKGSILYSGCHFTGYNKKYVGTVSGYAVTNVGTKDGFNYDSAQAMYTAFNSGTSKSTDFIETCVLKYLGE